MPSLGTLARAMPRSPLKIAQSSKPRRSPRLVSDHQVYMVSMPFQLLPASKTSECTCFSYLYVDKAVRGERLRVGVCKLLLGTAAPLQTPMSLTIFKHLTALQKFRHGDTSRTYKRLYWHLKKSIEIVFRQPISSSCSKERLRAVVDLHEDPATGWLLCMPQW